MKIVDYMLVGRKDSDNYHFSETIRSCIKSGWQPFGGPFTVNSRFDFYVQAMVKYEDNE